MSNKTVVFPTIPTSESYFKEILEVADEMRAKIREITGMSNEELNAEMERRRTTDCFMSSPLFHEEMARIEKETGRPNIIYALAAQERGDSSAMERLKEFWKVPAGSDEPQPVSETGTETINDADKAS